MGVASIKGLWFYLLVFTSWCARKDLVVGINLSSYGCIVSSLALVCSREPDLGWVNALPALRISGSLINTAIVLGGHMGEQGEL